MRSSSAIVRLDLSSGGMTAKIATGATDEGLGAIGVAPGDRELSPVRGPSAFGGSARRFVDLLWLSSAIEFRARYATTFLGYVWTVVRPLIFFGLIFLVMRNILGFGRSIPNYGLMLILNLVLFQYFQEATARALRSVTSKEGLVRKMQFPRIVIPLSVSLTAGFTLLLNLLAVFTLFLISGLQPRWTWLGLIVIILGLALLTTGLSLILSVAFVRSEDIGEAWLLVSRMLFYASPILYPIERVTAVAPESVRNLVAANPLSPFLEQARVWMIDPSAPTPVQAAGPVFGLVIPLLLIVAICVFGLWLFEREAPRVAEAL
jgi:ABC-2 type transport system permease protein